MLLRGSQLGACTVDHAFGPYMAGIRHETGSQGSRARGSFLRIPAFHDQRSEGRLSAPFCWMSWTALSCLSPVGPSLQCGFTERDIRASRSISTARMTAVRDFADLGIRKFCRRSIALHMQHSSCCNAAQVRKAVIEDSDNR